MLWVVASYEEGHMGTMMFNCPNTGSPVSAGVETDPYSFDFLFADTPVHLKCPLCGAEHIWQRKEAWLDRWDEHAGPPAFSEAKPAPA
jgi:endogenous inhibitor of DNA gyrase (YacG/DUF329 family)